jgi:hypothetical protein|tara:strand:- start:625 stop:810 length:186 start_codon:yes stop_codon:yes gene_type:complete
MNKIEVITNIALLGYVPIVIYLAHLKTKLNMLNFRKEKWRQTALMLEKERKEGELAKLYLN